MLRSAPASRRRSYREAAEDFRDNPGQLQAYESRGNCVVLAGPGSGKTKTLTVKLARMLAEDVRPPQGIACITYNLECAGELQHRLAALGVEEARNVFIGTVHSFCFKNIVLPYGHLSDLGLLPSPSVATDDQRAVLFESALKSAVSTDEKPSHWRVRFECYRRTYPDQKSRAFQETDEQVAALVQHYESALRSENLIDFDSMVLDGLRLIERHEWVRRLMRARFPILAVDEYQDLGLPLHRIVTSLCFNAGIRLLAVGDPDQSIYGAFGAQPELLQALAETKGVEAVRLPFNYRCGQTIVSMSETVLGQERGYQSKAKQAGTIDFYECPEGLVQQADRICREIISSTLARRRRRNLGDIAVLYLDRNDGEVIAEAVARAGMKFVRIDKGAPYRRTPLTRWIESLRIVVQWRLEARVAAAVVAHARLAQLRSLIALSEGTSHSPRGIRPVPLCPPRRNSFSATGSKTSQTPRSPTSSPVRLPWPTKARRSVSCGPLAAEKAGSARSPSAASPDRPARPITSISSRSIVQKAWSSMSS